MAVDTKALRSRIKSVNSTLHLTKAMGLVASSKIRRATDAMLKGREYAAAAENAVKILARRPGCGGSRYLSSPPEDARVRLVVIAGDRGLAGGYNANIFRLLRSLAEEGIENPEIIPIGKRSYDRFRESAPEGEVYGELYPAEGFTYGQALALARALCADFNAGKFHRLGILRTEYISMMTQQERCDFLLPLAFPAKEGEAETRSREILFEPDEGAVLASAVPEYIAGKLLAAVREAFACEVAARRVAMDAAGKNAKQMIDDLQLSYNRARQGAITQEITEIVAGSGNG